MPTRWTRRRRREMVRDGVLVAFGMGVGAVGFAEAADVTDRKLPLRGGAAAVIADRPDLFGAGRVQVTWSVPTTEKLVALTFDDGPHPRWTPMVLDILDRHRVPATFFMVGEQAQRHADIIGHRRMSQHDVGNHTWTHRDLARTDPDEAYDELFRTHTTLTDLTGREPRFLRPPYGHLSGGALAAAARMRYDIVLWSQQMRERQFRGDPAGQARHVVDRAQPGTILLAHDVGSDDRLVALDGLPDMITGLRARGFQFVTVSALLKIQR
ncbi:hypothetical protein GCM10011608_06910 [Micromonospora sonchi]|uniref:NodB homology domain-containing protein n=1 Tax=Micromonospora sonchi TaxID=1763543 RepID=A0A917TJE8_9ACTN|nr:polysaccharide deacetylase family protein [Micromonospora sonchi]GGM24693.1 hypothetical protein GCM10011608_06910 [Micromonospora sonchi]